MPIAPSTPQVEAPKTEPIPLANQTPTMNFVGWEGVPLDVFRYFTVDIGTTDKGAINKIKSIYEWARAGSQDLGQVMEKIMHLETKLGSPATGERRFEKMWFYTQMNKKMEYFKNLRDSVKK